MNFTICDIPTDIDKQEAEGRYIVSCKHNNRTLCKSCYAYTLDDIKSAVRYAKNVHDKKTMNLSSGFTAVLVNNFSSITSIKLTLCKKQTKYY